MFFAEPVDAEAAGFRACRRCRPIEAQASVELVRRACDLLETDPESTRTLAAWSSALGVSAGRLRQAFKNILGVSPRGYVEARRLERLKTQLQAGEQVTRALYEAGYGSSSRLYEGAREKLGMTPATYRKGGAGERIAYATTPCPLGWLLVAATHHGLCAVRLRDSEQELLETLRVEFPQADLYADPVALQVHLEALLRYLEGQQTTLDLPLDLRATAFQLCVWEYLRTIPYGQTRSYGQVAQAIGEPKAVRAVAAACAANPVALVIPCHRVVKSDGSLSGYRWGVKRKRKLLGLEATSPHGLSEAQGAGMVAENAQGL